MFLAGVSLALRYEPVPRRRRNGACRVPGGAAVDGGACGGTAEPREAHGIHAAPMSQEVAEEEEVYTL